MTLMPALGPAREMKFPAAVNVLFFWKSNSATAAGTFWRFDFRDGVDPPVLACTDFFFSGNGPGSSADRRKVGFHTGRAMWWWNYFLRWGSGTAATSFPHFLISSFFQISQNGIRSREFEGSH